MGVSGSFLSWVMPGGRWRHLLVGARNQDEAQALAAVIREQAPPSAAIAVLRVPGWKLSAAVSPPLELGG